MKRVDEERERESHDNEVRERESGKVAKQYKIYKTEDSLHVTPNSTALQLYTHMDSGGARLIT